MAIATNQITTVYPMDSVVTEVDSDGLPLYDRAYNASDLRTFMSLFVTDGVSDAFGTSSSLIDFLQKQPAKNPQTLADGVLGEALRISGGRKADDMTCLAVRVFEKKPA